LSSGVIPERREAPVFGPLRMTLQSRFDSRIVTRPQQHECFLSGMIG
jgi:hypothetical protein